MVLDQTVFFPEGGGQYADTGVLGTVNVTDVHEKDDVIYHYTTAPLEVGSIVTGKINWEERFEKMQQHTGDLDITMLVFIWGPITVQWILMVRSVKNS